MPTNPYITLMILLVAALRCGGTPQSGSATVQAPTHWSDERGNTSGPEPETLRTPPPLGLRMPPSFPRGYARRLGNGLKVAVLEQPTKLTTVLLLQIRSGRGTEGDYPGVARLSAALIDDGIRRAAHQDDRHFELNLEVRVDSVMVNLSSRERDWSALVMALKGGLTSTSPPLSRFDAVRQELARRAEDRLAQDDDWVSRIITHRELFGGPGLPHAYARYADPAADLKRRTASECAVWRKRHFVPENADLFVVGPVEHEQAFQIVEEQLAGWGGKRPESREPVRARGPERLTIQLVDRPDNRHVQATLSTLSAPRNSAAWPAVTLTSQALGGPQGELADALLRKVGVLAQIETDHEVLAYGPSVHRLQVRMDVEDATKVVRELILQVSKLSDEPLSKPATERGRGRAQAGLVTQLAAPQSAAAWLAEAALAGVNALSEPPSLFAALDTIDEAALFSASRPYFEPAHGVLVVVGPKKDLARDLARLAPIQVRDPARGFSVVESHLHDPTGD